MGLFLRELGLIFACKSLRYKTVREAMLPKLFGCHDQFGSPYQVTVDTMEIPKGVSGRSRPQKTGSVYCLDRYCALSRRHIEIVVEQMKPGVSVERERPQLLHCLAITLSACKAFSPKADLFCLGKKQKFRKSLSIIFGLKLQAITTRRPFSEFFSLLRI